MSKIFKVISNATVPANKFAPTIDAQPDSDAALRPWFVTFNPYFGPSTITFYWFDPFPSDSFPAISPWEDHVIVSHYGIDNYAKSAGYDSVGSYLKKLIFCAAKGL